MSPEERKSGRPSDGCSVRNLISCLHRPQKKDYNSGLLFISPDVMFQTLLLVTTGQQSIGSETQIVQNMHEHLSLQDEPPP